MLSVSVARAARRASVLSMVLLLASCGGGDGGDSAQPTVSPTRTPTVTLSSTELPSPTRSPDPTESTELPSPTRSPDPTESTEPPSPTRSPDPTENTEPPESQPSSQPPAQESTPESPAATAQETETPDASANDPVEESADDEGAAAWVWWLLVAVVVGSVVGIPLAMRARRRRAWREDLVAAEREIAWFARELLPELRQAGSREQAAGGWAVGQARVAAAEDRLTVMESTAPDQACRKRARTLRDLVRQARATMARLTGPEPPDTWALDLDEIIADLEVALRPSPGAGPVTVGMPNG